MSRPLRRPATRRATTRPGVMHRVLAMGLAAACAVGGGCSARNENTVLQSRVEQVLATALDVDADNVTVEAARGVVTVRGQVASGFEQQSVGAIVRAVPGVTRVWFDIQIEDPGAGR